MEDRDLQRRRSIRRKKRIKRRKKVNLARVLILLMAVAFLALLIFLGYKLINKAMESKKTPKTPTGQTQVDEKKPELSLDNEDGKEPAKKPAVSTTITPEMRKADLDKKIAQFIKDKGLKADEFAVGYFNMKTDESYAYNDSTIFGVGDAINFILAMDVYDLAAEKYIDLDGEIKIEPKQEEEKKQIELSKAFSIRQLIKLMLEENNAEAKDVLIAFVEEKSSKNWFDELSKRYGLDLSYKGEMSTADAMKALRRLFSERRMTAEERINSDDKDAKIKVYQEVINFMASRNSTNPLISTLAKNGQVSENIGNYYKNGALMGYVLGDREYLYVVMAANVENKPLYDGMTLIEQWHSYYNN